MWNTTEIEGIKKMKVVLIRHGKTVGNLYRTYVGQSDQPLCEEGKSEVLKRKMNAFYPVVNAVFTSPQLRCVQTAKLIYPEFAPVAVQELRERDFGRFEGLSHAEIIKLPGFATWGDSPDNMEFPEGESWEHFSQRSCLGFQKAVEQAAKRACRAAAIVCHGGTIMAVMERYVAPDVSRYEWQCVPGGGLLLKLEGKGITMIRRILT